MDYLKSFKNRNKYHTNCDLTKKLHHFCEKNERTKYYVKNL